MSSQNDRDNRFNITRNVAKWQGVWTYMNPDMVKAEFTVLDEPVQPDLPTGEPTPHGFDLYHFCYQPYQAKLDQYIKVQ